MCAKVLGKNAQPLATLYINAGTAGLWKGPQPAQQTQTEHRVLWTGEHHTTATGKVSKHVLKCTILFFSSKEILKSKVRVLWLALESSESDKYCLSFSFELNLNCLKESALFIFFFTGDIGLPCWTLLSAPRRRHVGRAVAEKMQVSWDCHSHCLWAAWLLWTGKHYYYHCCQYSDITVLQIISTFIKMLFNVNHRSGF